MDGHVLVTGGPTRAYLDRVRYLSNYSTGQLAFETCQTLSQRGAHVHAVVGPCAPDFESLPLASVERVETVGEMLAACLRVAPQCQWGVFAAAVLDFEPVEVGTGKTSSKGNWTVQLKPTPKIIDVLLQAHPKMKRVGFKLEWELPSDATEFAQKKIEEQQLDALVLNSLAHLSDSTHPALLYPRNGPPAKATEKKEIAGWIANQILKR